MGIYYHPPQPYQLPLEAPQLKYSVWGDQPPRQGSANDPRYLETILSTWIPPPPQPTQLLRALVAQLAPLPIIAFPSTESLRTVLNAIVAVWAIEDTPVAVLLNRQRCTFVPPIPIPVPPDAIARPISYYLGLITHQYQNSPKFLKWLSAPLSIIHDIQTCQDSMYFMFDLDYAVGVQQDILGQIIGVARTVPFQPSNSVSPVLDDGAYRLLQKAKVALNQWDGHMSSVQGIWSGLFPGGRITVTDNLDMTMTAYVTGAFSSIIKDLISNGFIVPRPMGVEINFVFGTAPFFGFDSNDSWVAGCDAGHWA